jgi:hypothetical protein
MDKKRKTIGITIAMLPIVSAIIWGAVIIGCSWKLKGTGGYEEIQNILYGGVVTHFILIGGVIAGIVRKNNNF